MPFFLKKCFKFSKNKKKNKKQDFYIKTFFDTTVRESEDEGVAMNDLNHSVTTNASDDTVSETSLKAVDENKNDDSCHDSDSQKSEIPEDDSQAPVRAEPQSTVPDGNSFDMNGSSDETVYESVDSKVVINEKNIINELQEELDHETNCSTTVMEVPPVSESYDVQEKMCIQKSVDIINNITVNSDVFEKIEELKALENALDNLREEIKVEEKKKITNNIGLGDSEHVNDDSHKIIKISDSRGSLDKEIQASTYCDDISKFSVEKKGKESVVATDFSTTDELVEDKQDLLKIDENLSITNDALKETVESTVSTILEIGNDNAFCDSENEIHDLNNNSHSKIENFSENLAVVRKEDAFGTCISGVSFESKEVIIQINKSVASNDSAGNKNKSENIKKINETQKSEENTTNNEIFLNTEKFVSEMNDIPKSLEEKSPSLNEYQATQESTELSAQNKTFSDTVLRSEYKVPAKLGTSNSDSIITTCSAQSIEHFDSREGSNLDDYQISETENEEKFKDLTDLKPLKDNCDEHHTEGNNLVRECDSAVLKSDSPLLNTVQRNDIEGSDLEFFSDSSEADCNFSETIKCIISKKCGMNCNSHLKAQNHDLENDSPLDDKLKDVNAHHDLFHEHNEENTCKICNQDTTNLNFKINKTFDRIQENKYDEKKEPDECNLELSKVIKNFMSEDVLHFDESEEDYISDDLLGDLKEEMALQDKNYLYDPSIEHHLNFEYCYEKSISAAPNDKTLLENKDMENFERVFSSLQNENILSREKNRDKTFENKSFSDRRQNNDSKTAHSNKKCVLDNNSQFETLSDYVHETLNFKAKELSISEVKKQQFDSISQKTKKTSKKQKCDEVLYNSLESLYENVEFCKDDNDSSEESVFNKYQIENQSLDSSPTYSSQDDARFEEKLHLKEKCQIANAQSNKQNKSKKHNYLQKGFGSYRENKRAKGDIKIPLKNNENKCKNISKILDNSNICNQLAKTQPRNGTKENVTFLRDIRDKLLSDNLLHEQNTQLTPKKERKRKSVRRYSLSECSISSEASNLSEKRDSKEEKLKAKNSNSFNFTGMGDSATEDNFENNTLRSPDNKLKNSHKSTKPKNVLTISKKRLPKVKKGQKIKICINKKYSSTDKDKTSINGFKNKHISDAYKNRIRLQSRDAINLLTYNDKRNQDSQIDGIKKSKYCEIPNGFRTSFNIHDKDAIEIKRKENINMFNKRKQNIMAQMGPNLRPIPVRNVDSIKVKSNKIEKLCLGTELNFLTERDYKRRNSPDSQKYSKIHAEKFSQMRKESPSFRKNVSVQYDVIPAKFLSESDKSVFDQRSEKMTPIRRKILDSSRSIRSPKYPLSLSCKETDRKKTFSPKPAFYKSPKQKIVVAHVSKDEKDTDGLRYKIYSPDFKKSKTMSMSPKKEAGYAEGSPRPQIHHTQNYRAMSPDDMKTKFDDAFKKYARKGRFHGELISYKRSTEWLIDAGVIDKMLTTEDATDAFKCAAGVKVALNKGDYREFLKKLTRVKKLNYSEVYKKLCEVSSGCLKTEDVLDG